MQNDLKRYRGIETWHLSRGEGLEVRNPYPLSFLSLLKAKLLVPCKPHKRVTKWGEWRVNDSLWYKSQIRNVVRTTPYSERDEMSIRCNLSLQFVEWVLWCRSNRLGSKFRSRQIEGWGLTIQRHIHHPSSRARISLKRPSRLERQSASPVSRIPGGMEISGGGVLHKIKEINWKKPQFLLQKYL